MPGENKWVSVAAEVAEALRKPSPVVALESALITHGLPYPTNEEMARKLEATVRAAGGTPATIAIMDGQVRIGLGARDLAKLAQSEVKVKVSRRDIAGALSAGRCGGTTVAATMWLASRQGIRVFATGGIGGVHRDSAYDVSADLPTLADTPMIVVCAGAKAILDLRATLEYLETAGVPVVGYQVKEFPAFYSRESGFPVSLQLDTPAEIAEYWKIHRSLGQAGAILIANPVPQADSVPRDEIEPIIQEASREASRDGIRGQALTPYLLERVSQLTGGRSVRANQALLLSNARLAAEVSAAMMRIVDQQEVNT